MSRNNIKILPGALVCEESKLRGDITIGAGTIVHPSATIIAEAGPIVIGDCCLVEEQAKIIHRLERHDTVRDLPKTGRPPSSSINQDTKLDIVSTLAETPISPLGCLAWDNNVSEYLCRKLLKLKTFTHKFCPVQEILEDGYDRLPFDQQIKENTPVLIIGSHNVFEVDCTVEACKIGDNNVFEAKCFVGNKVTVTNGCTIGAGCRITDEKTLKENLIVFGSKCQMREGLDRPGPQTLQMETLSKMLPNYHHIRKPNKKSS